MLSEREKEYRRKYNKTHPEARMKHDKVYRQRHKLEIAEYNRLNPELRIRLPLAIHERLKELPGGLRGLIERELSNREG
jgi:hypothetical protein